MTAKLNTANVFAMVTGVTDGVLTALTFAAGKIVNSAQPLSLGFAFRIAAASSLSGVFVFFTADYIRQRRNLDRAERQLNLTSRGRLAATRLGKLAARDSGFAALIACGCNALGALLPLLVGALVPRSTWLGVSAALIALAVLGVTAARILKGNLIAWPLALVLAGGLLTLLGMKLRIA